MIDDIETRLQQRLDIEPDTLYSDALTAIQGARALNVEYAAALKMCERRNEQLRAVVTAAQAYRAAWVGSPALFPDGPLAIGAAWTDLDDALAALKGAGDD